MFGATVESKWGEGNSIVWKGEWQGRAYEDRGTILRFELGRLLQYSHFSPLSGLPDEPQNYHTMTVELLRVTPAGRAFLCPRTAARRPRHASTPNGTGR